jgi:hypothetical protein
MLVISQIETHSTTRAFSEKSGIPRHLLDAKLVRLGINHSGYVSFTNQEYLQEIYIKEGKDEFILTFSKMNYEQT